MPTYLKYKVWCNDENVWKNWILDESDPKPTTCPTNSAHTINTTLTSVINTIEESKIIIREEMIETGGHFQTESGSVTAGAGETNQHYMHWPFPISAMALEFVISDEFKGDQISVLVGENTIVGALGASTVSVEGTWVSQNYTVGQVVEYTLPILGKRYYTCILDTVSNEVPTNKTYWKHGYALTVSPTVLDNADKGYFINLFDGVNSDDVGRIVFKDTENSKIYVETPPSNSFSALSPTYVRMTVAMFKDFEISNSGPYIIGESKIGGSYVPADTVVTLKYKNNGTTEKTFIGRVEYLY